MMVRGGSSIEGGRHVLIVDAIGAYERGFAAQKTSKDIAGELSRYARRLGCRVCHGDNFMGYALAPLFHDNGLRFVEHKWTEQSKGLAVSRVRTWLRDRSLVIEAGDEGDRMRREMLTLEERLLPSGGVSFDAKRTRSGHSNRLSCLLTAAMADAAGALGGSPIQQRLGVNQRPNDYFRRSP